jgi:hypothetical protein
MPFSSRPNPVLVTGSFRSGTTWVGRTLTRSPELSWVAEPFHVKHRRGVFASPTPSLYTYVCADNEHEHDYLANLTATIDGRYAWRAGLSEIRRPVDVGIAAKDIARFGQRRLRGQRALLKDPIALFSAPWIADRFGADVIVMVRHPAAIMASLARLGWRFNINHLLRQPLLMRDLLAPWETELRDLQANDDRTLVDEAALVWRVMYDIVDRWRDEHPDWTVVRHEDLSREPVEGFRALFDAVAVDMTSDIESFIRESTSASNPTAAPDGQAHALQRDSKANANRWLQALDADDVARLRVLVDDVAQRFYGPEDW